MATWPATLSVVLWMQAQAPSTVRLSEVAYDVIGVEPDGEWVELVNLGHEPALLDELRLGDEEEPGGTEATLAFPLGTILQPGRVVVIASSAAAFEAAQGVLPDFEVKSTVADVAKMTVDRSLGGSRFQLANATDEVVLTDALGARIDGVSWGRGAPLPGVTDTPLTAEGQTVARDLDEATATLRPWSVGAASAGELRVIAAPIQEPTPPPDSAPEEPSEPPAPVQDDTASHEPDDAVDGASDDDGAVDHDHASDDESVDDGSGIELEREPSFQGPIVPEAGGCSASGAGSFDASAGVAGAWALVQLLRRRRRRR